MNAGGETAPLLAAFERLGAQVAELCLPLDLADAEAARRLRREIADQLDDYVLPRLRRLDAPLLAVVGGPTGAGKSTLVNSLVGARVSASGVLRPTTRSAVLAHHPADARWFDERNILPGLERSTDSSSDPASLQLVRSEHLPAGLALLDAPTSTRSSRPTASRPPIARRRRYVDLRDTGEPALAAAGGRDGEAGDDATQERDAEVFPLGWVTPWMTMTLFATCARVTYCARMPAMSRPVAAAGM